MSAMSILHFTDDEWECPFCNEPLDQWWVVDEFAGDVYWARLEAQDDEVSTVDLSDLLISARNATQEDGSSLYDHPWEIPSPEIDMICCDKTSDKCTCKIPLSGKYVGSWMGTQQLDPERIYDTADPTVPSCMNCDLYMTNTCLSLRQVLQWYLDTGSVLQPIVPCKFFVLDENYTERVGMTFDSVTSYIEAFVNERSKV